MRKFMRWSAAGAGLATTLLFVAGTEAQVGQFPGMGSMPGMSGSTGAAGAQQASATGTVMSVDTAGRKVKFDHEAIPAISWPAMKMEFAAAPTVDLTKVKPGDKVQFSLAGSNGSYTVQSITPAR